MRKVITYGTYDLFHQGHFNLLKRAKALGDYLIVGVTTDNFDLERGKLNVCNNVMERIEAVRATGLADQIIIEEYIGQKLMISRNSELISLPSAQTGTVNLTISESFAKLFICREQRGYHQQCFGKKPGNNKNRSDRNRKYCPSIR